MSRNKLPRIYAKWRKTFWKDQPPVVVCFRGEDALPSWDEINAVADANDGNLPVEYYGDWWIEVEGMGAIRSRSNTENVPIEKRLYSREEAAELDYLQHDVQVWTMKGLVDEFRAGMNIETIPMTGEPEIDDGRVHTMKILMHTAVWMRSLTSEDAPVSVNTQTRLLPRVFARKGDTVNFARVTDLRSKSRQDRQRGYEAPDVPSGIRKRDHAVRGHWRTYKSGVRVWVNSHRRGDPELGTVTRVIG